MPATVPYTAAFVVRPPRPPNRSSTTDTAATRAIASAHSFPGAFSRPPAGSPKMAKSANPSTITSCAGHLASTDVLARQEVAERQGEHDCRDEQRLDDREASTVERRRLEDVSGEKRQRPGEPGSLLGQPQERRRLGQRDRREVESAFLLERRRDGEQQRRDKGESRRHFAEPTLRGGRPKAAGSHHRRDIHRVRNVGAEDRALDSHLRYGGLANRVERSALPRPPARSASGRLETSPPEPEGVP